MIKIYKTDDQIIHEEKKLNNGVWVQMICPTRQECEDIADALNVDIDDVQAALDQEESSRIELQEDYPPREKDLHHHPFGYYFVR